MCNEENKQKKIDEKLNKEMNFGKHSIKNKQRKKNRNCGER
jgi:hypothetical protein